MTMSRRFTPTPSSLSDPRASACAGTIVGPSARAFAQACAGLAPVIALFTLAAVLIGCAQSRTYEGHSRDEVWQAMLFAAKHPRYRDWIVMDNQTWADEPAARIEIFRELKRDVVLPGQDPYREETEWRLRSALEEGEVPVVRFSTSNMCIPAHFWLQADHYFDEVQSRLASAPPPSLTVPTVRLDDPMLLPPSSVTASEDTRDDILDSVPPPGANAIPGMPPPPPPAAARPSGQSKPMDIP